MIPHEFNKGMGTPGGIQRYRDVQIIPYQHKTQRCPGVHCASKTQSAGQFVAGSALCAKCRRRA